MKKFLITTAALTLTYGSAFAQGSTGPAAQQDKRAARNGAGGSRHGQRTCTWHNFIRHRRISPNGQRNENDRHRHVRSEWRQ